MFELRSTPQERIEKEWRSMVKIGICDDEPQMRKPLSQTLEQVLQLQGVEYQIAEYASGEELTAGISCLDTDILF